MDKSFVDMVSSLGIELAPLKLPLERRLQTLAAIYFSFSFFGFGLLSISLCVYILFYASVVPRVLLFVYLVWYIWDMNSCIRGGRRSNWVRSWTIWRWFRDFFPIHLVKTADLDPEQNYIFGYHPHGITSAGAFSNFATEATGFSEKFPGIVPHLLTLEGQFFFPLHRELVLACGLSSVSRESIINLLNYKGKGNAAIIVIGGAQEALDAVPETYRLNLNSRRGFVRMAIQNGAQLVPVFSFGENDIFYQSPSDSESTVRKIQVALTRMLGFSPPIFHGRGVFQYTWGFIPFRKPIYTVIGAPIHVKKNADPSIEEIQDLHKKYIQALRSLFETHKKSFGAENIDLEIH
ncbi:2-acylglycerol O-acyltransferase 2 [Galendromus occidentalis]|uniref:Acyltransferase n=1 Tax=Galendromus occidentalis TaxID=34638 RepID=A0AAJ6QVW1_9ACAR|nr:2-acylglycerol O-acyltransferase 2 [Galendromus occidentalis]